MDKRECEILLTMVSYSIEYLYKRVSEVSNQDDKETYLNEIAIIEDYWRNKTNLTIQ